jgi:hypothetical protein
MANAA